MELKYQVEDEEEEELRKRIEVEEQYRMRIVETQRKLEEELDSLKDELEEKEEHRAFLERKRKQVGWGNLRNKYKPGLLQLVAFFLILPLFLNCYFHFEVLLIYLVGSEFQYPVDFEV